MVNLAIGPLALFVLVSSITPGPNNLLLLRSGAAFGVRRSLGHLAGVQLGFAGLVVLSHLGVGALLLALPGAFLVLRWACFGYLMYLAWLILRDSKPAPAVTAAPAVTSRPMRLVEAVLFQFVNPKAWMMTITIATAFYGNAAPRAVDLAAAVAVSLPIGAVCMLVWTAWGASIHAVLRTPRAMRIYSIAMALTVALTAVWMLR